MSEILLNVITRLSSVAIATKALPDKDMLRGFARDLFKGLVFLMIGSVVLAAAIIVVLFAIYDQMMIYGFDKAVIFAVIFGVTLIIALICFLLADKWLKLIFNGKPKPKSIIEQKLDFFKDLTTETVDGFIEGLLNRPSGGNSKKYR